MPIFTDMLGRTLEISNFPPKRIVSLVPSITETVSDLIGIKSLVGVTNYCVHPQEVRTQSQIIGGTKNVKIQDILSLKPDLVIANKEENYQEVVLALESSVPVYVTDINHTDDALEMILQLGEILDCSHKALAIASHIQILISKIPIINESISAAYLIWKKPYMAAGSDTYINSMMEWAGLENAFKNKLRYPETTLEELKQLNPQVVMLSSEPYPFKAEHVLEIQSILPNSKVLLVDGEVFSWYGTRMIPAFQTLPALIENWL